MGWIVPKSIVTAPCPSCGGTPVFTQAPSERVGSELRRPVEYRQIAYMLCECGFEGNYASLLSLEECYAAWNEAVAWENRRRQELAPDLHD